MSNIPMSDIRIPDMLTIVNDSLEGYLSAKREYEVAANRLAAAEERIDTILADLKCEVIACDEP